MIHTYAHTHTHTHTHHTHTHMFTHTRTVTCSFSRACPCQLGYNQITDMASLKLGHLNELKVLFLQGNEIAKVDGLEGCHELRELVLDKNRIKFVDPYR